MHPEEPHQLFDALTSGCWLEASDYGTGRVIDPPFSLQDLLQARVVRRWGYRQLWPASAKAIMVSLVDGSSEPGWYDGNGPIGEFRRRLIKDVGRLLGDNHEMYRVQLPNGDCWFVHFSDGYVRITADARTADGTLWSSLD